VRARHDGLQKVALTTVLAAPLVLCAFPVHGQPVIPAKAGLVSYTRGRVYLDDRQIRVSGMRFPDVKENSVLRTGRGRAEVLLGPCTVLRLDDNSSFRMLSASLTAPQSELLAGSAVVDISALAKGALVTLKVSGTPVSMARSGVYRFDFSPALLKVFEGRASLPREAGTVDVTAGRMLLWDGDRPERFDVRGGDGLDLWSHQRSIVLAEGRAAGQRPRTVNLGGIDDDISAAGGRVGGRGMGRGGGPAATMGGGWPIGQRGACEAGK
jgi:hypothetical protein